jgi:4-amino-4-deoxy-L-arabinose transferase-like glycosyltransferase
LGVLLLSLATKTPLERRTVLNLFVAAFALRIIFTVVAYNTQIIDALGGGDDRQWINMWILSRRWHGLQGYSFIGVPYPETLKQIYDGSHSRNRGYHYFGTEFFYYLNVQSQMALSFVNCFAGSLTVVLVYRTARDFFSRRAALCAALICLLMPGLIMWPALTIKETWVIFFQSLLFFAVWRLHRDRKPIYALAALAALVLVLGFRYYIAYLGLGAALLSMVVFRARRPARAALLCVGTAALLVAGGLHFQLLHFDPIALLRSQMEEAASFGQAVATRGSRNASGIVLGYDVTTTGGALKQIGAGSLYLLFSPFPWQGLGGRQVYALPDVLLWWGVFFALIIPGAVAAWRRQRALLIAVAIYVLPLVMIYSVAFGNVGLAYRQRAQLIPLLLILAAGGYDAWARRRAAQQALNSPPPP